MTKYNLSIRILHWVIGVVVLLMIGVGFIMTGYVQPPVKYSVYKIHKAVGITILLLILIRMIIRLFTKAPPVPNQFSLLERVASKFVHLALYVLVFFTALSGYVMSSAGGRTIDWFGVFEVPLLTEVNKEVAVSAHSMHVVLPYVLLGFATLHVLATLKHIFIDKINILRRII